MSYENVIEQTHIDMQFMEIILYSYLEWKDTNDL